MKVTKHQLIEVAKKEMREWRIERGLVMVILWAFIERVCNGEPIEATYFKKSEPIADYEI